MGYNNLSDGIPTTANNTSSDHDVNYKVHHDAMEMYNVHL